MPMRRPHFAGLVVGDSNLNVDTICSITGTSFGSFSLGMALTIRNAWPLSTKLHCRQTPPGRGVSVFRYNASLPATFTFVICCSVGTVGQFFTLDRAK